MLLYKNNLLFNLIATIEFNRRVANCIILLTERPGLQERHGVVERGWAEPGGQLDRDKVEGPGRHHNGRHEHARNRTRHHRDQS